MTEQLVFDETVVTSHRLYKKFHSDLDSLCRRDYHGRTYFNKEIKCLDMDAVESAGQGMTDCTMDAAVGIATYQNNTSHNPMIALVELRLGYTNANFHYSNMSRKVSHTTNLLSESAIHKVFYFVFTEQLYQRVESVFGRWARTNSECSHWKSVSPTTFLNDIRFKEDIPFTPETNLSELKANFFNSFFPDYENAIRMFEHWEKVVDNFRNKSNHREANAILRTLYEVADCVDCDKESEMQIVKDLMLEDILRKIKSMALSDYERSAFAIQPDAIITT